MTGAAAGDSSSWRRSAAEFVVIVVGVFVALAVDSARGARADRVRETDYLQQLRTDLSATAEGLEQAIAVDERARDGADRVVRALSAGSLPPRDSLAKWTISATNSSASFYPTMGTVTALVVGGEVRLIRDERLRQRLLEYHSSVEGTLRIIDGVDPHMWRTIERLGGIVSWEALIRPEEVQRFAVDWETLAANRGFQGGMFDLELAAQNRLFALRSLRASLDALFEELERSSQ